MNIETAAPAAVLTIDAKELRSLWIPCEREESDALEYMEAACKKALGKPRYAPMHKARMAVFFQWRNTVDFIHRQGGLLHVGCAGALA